MMQYDAVKVKNKNNIKHKKPVKYGLSCVTQSGFEPETYCLEGSKVKFYNHLQTNILQGF
jgi:hypothetical protein